MAKTQDKTPAPAAVAKAPSAGKSIIKETYRDRYKEQDWLGKLIAEHATKTRTVEKTVGEGDAAKKVPTQVPDGVDLDALFNLATLNNINVEKYQTQRGTHGFEGRFRMTLRNMLQATVKARHGLFVPGKSPGSKTWVSGDKEWLLIKAAPTEPTHDKGGEKFAAKTPPKAETKAAA